MLQNLKSFEDTKHMVTHFVISKNILRTFFGFKVGKIKNIQRLPCSAVFL